MKYLIALMLLFAATVASANAADKQPAKGGKPAVEVPAAPAPAVVAETAPEAAEKSPVMEDTVPSPAPITEGSADTPTKTEPAFGVKHTETRIVKLPQDGNKPFLSIIGNPNDPRIKEIKSWFESNDQLREIKKQSTFNVIDMTQSGNVQKYGPSLPATPCVRLQDHEGHKVYQVSGKNIPMSAEALGRGLNSECFRRWRQWRGDDRRNNDRKVDPQPDTQPDGDEENDYGDDNGSPDTQPSPQVEGIEIALGILAVGFIGLIGGGILALAMKNNHNTIPKG